MPTIKQYVNLDPDDADQLDGLAKARAGITVTLEATVDPAEEGVGVVFKIKRGDDNLYRAGKTSKRTATTGDDGKAKIDFDLTENGGDKFTVTAYLEDEGDELGKNTYVVWKRLYYQMSRFRKGTPGDGQPDDSLPAVPALDLDGAIDELKGHFIQLVDKSTKATIKRYANVIDQEPGRTSMKKSAEDGYEAKYEPVTVRVVAVNQIATSKTTNYKKEDVKNEGKLKLKFPDDLWDDPSCDKDEDWLISVKWRWNDESTWHRLDSKWIKRTSKNRVEIDLDGADLGGEDDEDRTIDVRVSYRYDSGSSNGRRRHNAVWLASSCMNGEARSADELKQTTIHEIGHTLGMVPVTQSSHYIEHGHAGNHCNTGLSSSERAGDSYEGLEGTCIMFGESSDSRQPHFCPKCVPSVRKADAKIDGLSTGSW
jgi:hypothetical protein